jgi:hypothetical protein
VDDEEREEGTNLVALVAAAAGVVAAGVVAAGVVAAGVVAAGVVAAGVEAAALDPEPESLPLELPVLAWQVPVGAAKLSPLTCKSGPGLGKVTSLPGSVPQPFPTLATKTAGRAEKAVRFSTSRFFDDPLPIVTLAQFMYISRLPTSLNQVQANNTSVPAGASEGMVKSKDPPVEMGHSP